MAADGEMSESWLHVHLTSGQSITVRRDVGNRLLGEIINGEPVTGAVILAGEKRGSAPPQLQL